MVRIFTFVGLCAGTYVGVRAVDSLLVWMADRREANVDNFNLEREAAQLKRQLLREIQEKQATTPNKGLEKHHIHQDKHYEFTYKHLKQQYDSKLLGWHEEGKQHILPDKNQDQQDNANLVNRHQEDENRKLSRKAQKKQNDQKLTLPEKHQDQQDNAKLVNEHQEDEHRKLSDKVQQKQNDKKLVSSQQENCPGEIHAECLECGEVFEIVEPVPHIRKPDSPTSMI